MAASTATLHEDMERVKETLWNPETGHVVRLTKIETSLGLLIKFAWISLSAVTIAFCTVMGELIVQHLK
jgi:hypothetical protein